MKSPAQTLYLVLAVISSLTSADPVPKQGPGDKNIRVGIRRWDRPICAGEGASELIPRLNIRHNECLDFRSRLQHSNDFVSFVATWTKHWEHDGMFLYGRCRLKVYSDMSCAGTVMSVLAADHWEGACHDMPHGTAASMSLYCDYNKPVAPGTRYWDAE